MKQGERFKNRSLKNVSIVIIIGAIFILFAFIFRLTSFYKSGEKEINISSMLTDSVDLSQLSTAEFRYRGIADIYKDEAKTKILCRVCYNAVVKAGIDVNDIVLEVDSDKKTVLAVLPDIELKVTVIDEESMALLPSDADVGIDQILTCSKEDAEREAKDSTELMNTAEVNLKAAIEGLLYPVLKMQGYSLTWK